MFRKFLFICVLMVFSLTACTIDLNQVFNINAVHGSGNVITKSFEIRGVDKVRLLGAGELTIHQGEEEGLTIQAEDNVLEYMEVVVDGDTLKIGFKKNFNIIPTQGIKIDLKVKGLELIDISGAGEVRATDIQTPKLDVILNGGGSFVLAGKADVQNVVFNGAGNYDAGNLQSQEVVITSNGAGSATVWAVEKLSITLNGAGSLSYYGSPQVSQTINGIGSIHHLGDR